MSVDSDLSSFEPSTSAGSGGMMVPLLVGFAGLLLGGAALYFSLAGSGQTDDAQSKLETITAKAEGLETRLRDLEEKYSAMASELEAAKQTTNQIARDINTEFKEVGVEISRNRDMIETSADKLTELINTLNREGRPTASRPASSQPVASAPSPAPSSAGASVSPASQLPLASAPASDPSEGPVVIGQQMRMHTIRQGDTFSSLSKQYGVAVSSILAANPDVDPRRLAIGQKIKIPASD